MLTQSWAVISRAKVTVTSGTVCPSGGLEAHGVSSLYAHADSGWHTRDVWAPLDDALADNSMVRITYDCHLVITRLRDVNV